MKLAAKQKKDKEYKCQVQSQKGDELKSQEPKIDGDAVASPDSVFGPEVYISQGLSIDATFRDVFVLNC